MKKGPEQPKKEDIHSFGSRLLRLLLPQDRLETAVGVGASALIFTNAAAGATLGPLGLLAVAGASMLQAEVPLIAFKAVKNTISSAMAPSQSELAAAASSSSSSSSSTTSSSSSDEQPKIEGKDKGRKRKVEIEEEEEGTASVEERSPTKAPGKKAKAPTTEGPVTRSKAKGKKAPAKRGRAKRR